MVECSSVASQSRRVSAPTQLAGTAAGSLYLSDNLQQSVEGRRFLPPDYMKELDQSFLLLLFLIGALLTSSKRLFNVQHGQLGAEPLSAEFSLSRDDSPRVDSDDWRVQARHANIHKRWPSNASRSVRGAVAAGSAAWSTASTEATGRSPLFALVLSASQMHIPFVFLAAQHSWWPRASVRYASQTQLYCFQDCGCTSCVRCCI